MATKQKATIEGKDKDVHSTIKNDRNYMLLLLAFIVVLISMPNGLGIFTRRPKGFQALSLQDILQWAPGSQRQIVELQVSMLPK